ncbi:MAG: aminopeptidase [Clostridiales bacterium]|nr:aminopeptidase [Clostridiales bacterium]
MLTPKQKEYMRLLVEVGVNIQQGQKLIISCQVENAEFARECQRIAYENGCQEVIMRWIDDPTTRMKYLHAADEVFDTCPEWLVRFMTDYSREGAATLHLVSDDPESLLGVDPSRLARWAKVSGEALKEYREMMMRNENAWSIGALSAPAWAKKVFPELPEAEAIEALWDKIFTAVRVLGDGSAVGNWQKHAAKLKERMHILNEYNFKALRYRNALGTDFTVELAENHVWEAGGDVTTKGVPFMPNMPTEEIFTAPRKTGANGVVMASMPLCLKGTIINDIRFVFENGKIIEATASSGEALLREEIALDEGASFLGEVALVPYDSPIRQAQVLFYETLYDENASCHLAFGEAYPSCIKGGTAMSKDESKAAGLNDSITHVDFMLGTEDLSIVGITQDGVEMPVFVDGLFAF